MTLDVSVILPLRNSESTVASMVRTAVEVLHDVPQRDQREAPSFEILAVDERSGDNTLALLSVLHRQIPQIRTLQDLDPGSALARASVVARGRTWILADHPVPPDLLRWGVLQVLGGHHAALVPGQLLAVQRSVGGPALARLRGGLVSAQQAVQRALRRRGERPAYSPPPDRGLMARAILHFRGRAGRMGLGRLDRPRRDPRPDDSLGER